MMAKYDVCLSFAGGDRDYVEEVARHLTELGVSHFFDTDEQADLWGKNLVEHLDQIYRHDSLLRVIFVSQAYVRKMWSAHERRSVLSRALDDPEYLLLARFDDSEVPGLRSSMSIVFLDLRNVTPRQFAEIIARRVIAEAPATTISASDQAFAATVQEQMKSLIRQQVDHKLSWREELREFHDDIEAMDYLLSRVRKLDRIITSIARLFSHKLQDWAFEQPDGEGASAKHLAERFTQTYSALLEWSADLRGTVTSERFERLYELTTRLADEPIEQIDTYVEGLREDATLHLVVSYNPTAVERLENELKRLGVQRLRLASRPRD